MTAPKTAREALEEVVRDNLPYLENLILPHGHESVLLREHPEPCHGHDFCLVHQAQKGADAIHVALDRALAAQQPQEPEAGAEWRRLKEIEHFAWHLMDASEENASTGEIIIEPMREDYDALSALLPEDHPDASALPARAQPASEYRPATLAECIYIIRARLSEQFSPAEKEELLEAVHFICAQDELKEEPEWMRAQPAALDRERLANMRADQAEEARDDALSKISVMDDHELAIVEAYRAGMKNGIREYAVWKDGEQLVGVMRRPLKEVLVAVDAVPAQQVLRVARSQMAPRI